jgi:invasion protein IalB
MNRRPALLYCALAIMPPTSALAEYPRYLNVIATSNSAPSVDSGAKFRTAAVNPPEATTSRFYKPKPKSASHSPPASTMNSLPEYRETTGAWVTQCWTAPTKKCEVLQQHVDKTTGQQLLLIGFSINQHAVPQLTMVTSTEFKARPSISLMVEQETFVEAPLKGCIATGCVHILDISADHLTRLGSSKNANTTVQLPNDELRIISLDIDGLAKSVEKAQQFIN